MKYLLLGLFFLCACNKNQKNDTPCYKCQITQGMTVPARTVTICSDRRDTFHFEEPNGSLGFDCEEIK